MNVEFFKKDKPVQKKGLIEALESAVHHYFGMWGVVYQDYNIFIDLDLKKDQYDYQEGKNTALGGSLKVDDKNFLIFLDIKGIEKSFGKGTPDAWLYLLSALAHECIHVKQYIKNELSFTDDGSTLWMGEDISHLSYDESPHEIEAYKYQEEMAIEFFMSLSYADIED